MGKADVVKEICESYELIKAHYREVLLPLFLIFVLQAGMSGGGSFGGRPSQGSYEAGPMVAGAMNDLLAIGLSGVFLAIMAVVIAVILVMSILQRALWFYVYEHFHALVLKNKIEEEWQSRMRRHGIRALFFMAFWAILFVLVLVYPLINAYSLLTSNPKEQWVSLLLPLALPFVAAITIYALLAFLLSPLWVYYAIDRKPFFESASRSFTLVLGNLGTFIVFSLVFFAMGVAGVLAAIATCCFAILTLPAITLFLSLLYGVSLMKIKLALEK